MQKLILKFTPTPLQLYFMEKSVELLHRNTIDSFRLRINNSKSIINELVEVCYDLKNGRLKNHDYAKLLAEECKRTINDCSILSFGSIDKNYFNKLLDDIIKRGKQDYGILIHAGRIILEENHELSSVVIRKLIEIFENENPSEDYKSKIKITTELVHFFLIELIYMGYTKHYLINYFLVIFAVIPDKTFLERLRIVTELINRQKEKYHIVLGINSELSNRKRINIQNLKWSLYQDKIKHI